jgi:serine O-acetyltransferase
MFERIREDFSAVFARDPAARSRLEIIFCYPGFQALQLYRMANGLWRREFYFLARLLSHVARMVTGIEIHPGATIGKRFFIDHGMGVVIGETAIIEDDVTLYHDVTLGGVSPVDESKGQLRHPHVQSGVIVGAGAQLLGPVTIGKNARIGSNAVVVRDVAEDSIMVGVPAHRVMKGQKKKGSAKQQTPSFEAYAAGMGQEDPLVHTIRELQKELQTLRKRVGEVESKNDPEGASAKAWESKS